MVHHPCIKLSLLLLCLPLHLFPQTNPTVAVLDFQGRGISEQEAQSLTDRFATSLGNTGEIILVERNAMEEILQEQGFQQSGCTTSECAVEVGKLLGVQFMINGSIGLVGRTYTVDAKMFSVESGASVRNTGITYQGEIDGLLIEMSILSWEILGLEPPAYLLQQRSRGIGSLMDRPKTVAGAVTRSLLIPGGGQFYLGRKTSGTLFLTTEVLAFNIAFYTIRLFHISHLLVFVFCHENIKFVAGHTKANMTRNYTHPQMERIRETIGRLG